MKNFFILLVFFSTYSFSVDQLVETDEVKIAVVEEQVKDLPKYIYVSGMPLMLRGWNGKYKLKITPFGPEWHLVSLSYYGLNIIKTKIFKEGDHWYFNDFYEWQRGFKGPQGNSPLGEWEHFLVTDKQDVSTWVRSNLSKNLSMFLRNGLKE